MKPRAKSKQHAIEGERRIKQQAKEGERKRQPLTPEVIIDIAEARFESLRSTGQPTPMGKLEERFKRDRATISKAISRAFKEGLVEFHKIDKPLPPALDDQLRTDLLNKYPRLQDAVVIKSSPTWDDDRVHRNLGMAQAEFISTKAIIQKNQVLGVGSGRGVERTIQSLVHFGKQRAQNVTLMSLTASVYSTPKHATKGLWLDADRHVIEFARHFENEPAQYLISHPIAYATKAELNSALRRVWLGSSTEGENAVPKLTHVFVGVATFVPIVHRFYFEATAEPHEQEPFLKPIHNDLNRLKQLCEEAIAMLPKDEVLRHYSPAAEMSNFFFFVSPPGRFGTLPNEQSIMQCIEQINSKLLNVRQEQLFSTQMLVVAGAKRKSHALRALLEKYPVTYLCTDADAAKEIISGRA